MTNVPPLTSAERQALSLQAVVRVWMLAPDASVGQDVLQAVEREIATLKEAGIDVESLAAIGAPGPRRS